MNNFDYKNMTPFKWFVLENFPFIENDFESINNYRLFSKVVEYLNKTIYNMNLTGEQMENVTNAMTELQNYVNNYFENLDVQEEINQKLDEMVESGQLEDIIADYLKSVNNCYIAALTKQDKYTHDNQAYLGISFDGQCFTPIPQTKGFCNKHTDIQMFKYNDYYLFACTTSATETNPNIDCYVGWTRDFENYHFENVSLGFTQYRNSKFPSAENDRRRWTPRFYVDKENNLNILISMATNDIYAYDRYNIQQRTQMKIFHQTVKFNANETNFLTGNGDIDYFKIIENNNEVDTFFDGELIVHDNVYYLLYKNAYYNDVCIAISTTDDYSIFNTTQTSIFENPYTEAPCVVKSNDGYLIYGQQYQIDSFNDNPRNLLLFTKDFNEFINIGYPKRLYADYKKDGIMRNLSPCLIENKALVTKFKTMVDVIGFGCYDNNEIKTEYKKLLDIIKLLNNDNRKCSIFNNSWIRCNESIENVIINNLWNADEFIIFGTEEHMNAYNVQLVYNNVKDRLILCGSYPTAKFKISSSFIRNPNRSFIPNSYKLIDNSSENFTNEVIILPNSQYAKAHIYNKSHDANYNKYTDICNLNIKNFQNEMMVYGTVTSSVNNALPVGTIIPFKLYSSGILQSLIDLSGCQWKADFIFMLSTSFYE